MRVCLFGGVRLQGLAGVSSMSPPGGNQVDGLPPAFSLKLIFSDFYSSILRFSFQNKKSSYSKDIFMLSLMSGFDLCPREQLMNLSSKI